MPRPAVAKEPALHRTKTPLARLLVLALLPLAATGCGGEDDGATGYDRAATFERLGLTDAANEAELAAGLAALDEAPVDPPPVVGEGYNPVFPPDLPFDPGEWTTRPPPPTVADPRARKGGRLVVGYPEWPPTLRTEGPNSRLSFLSDIQYLVYETLLGIDPVTMEMVPGLATHWWISDDHLTYRFRLDPEARFANGMPVTADDVVATIQHLQNPDRRDPLTREQWRDLVQEARVLDRLTVEVRTKEPRWRALLTISGQLIYPAAFIRMDGATYLEDWNWKLPPGSGPYEVRTEDIKKGRSLTLRRRPDWWARGKPENEGLYNFDEIEWQIVRDEELMYQKFLAGELDLYIVNRAQRWVQEIDLEPAVQKGWVQKRKIYNREPQGFGGYCFNLREAPFDDNRVREAFAYLLDRETLFAKLLYYQYEPMDSYFQGLPYARPDAESIPFDPARARRLLAEAGWTGRDAQGYLVNERGERFPSLVLEFSGDGWLRIHSVYATDLWDQAGVKLELKPTDDASLLKKIWDYKFNITWWNWTGSLFPEPKYMFHSSLADPKNTNNIVGLKNAEVDRIVTDYQFEFDVERRIRMLQRLDEILCELKPYVLSWYGAYFRILYWDRFGHPPEYAARTVGQVNNVIAFWWHDPERDDRTAANRAANRPNHPDSPYDLNQYDAPEQRWWNTHDLPMREYEEGGR